MFTIRKITFVLAWMIILVFPGALKTVHADEAVYNVVPRITWSLSKDKSAMYAFTFGDGVYAFLFDPVNAEGMEYLEFDVYIPDAEVIDRWKTGETEFETGDVPVAMANVSKAPYNADLTGVEDSTKAIQDALYDVSLCGGGTVWMAAGTYRITGSIKIPAYVTLRGDWGDPGITEEYGTLVALDIPESDRHDTGTFTLGGCGGVYSLTVYYPNQSVEDVKYYPFTFYTAGTDTESYLTPSVINCTVLNGYRGIGATTHSVARWEDVGHENMYVLNFRGTFLECGAECYNESDFGFWDDVKISTKYWMNAVRAGLLDPVDEERLKVYTKEHADGLILGDLDWVSLNNITVESCSVGIHIVPGKRPETDFQGLLYGISTTDCTRGMVVDALHPDIGMVLANSSIDDGLYNTTNTVVRMFNVEVNGLKEGRLLEKAGKTGGVVYLPGRYVPAGCPCECTCRGRTQGNISCTDPGFFRLARL